ncbi:helix-turn-helix transcriptional regulator [Vallitalea okinawensis]|uniref:helix-turn-helix transcriptional regulator n=1 Tax=Vallitalea okinawensis TaxID=2078660 RepID=UPI001FA83111|nr:helix-turn-helix domain-containing protein [Vallitalea okinawensis]
MSKVLDSIAKEQLIKNLTDNLPVLRAKLGITQTELAETIGVSRQTIIAIENGKRKMTWSMFIALTLLFLQNEATSPLLPVVDIYTKELAAFLSFGSSSENSEKGGNKT